MDFKPTSAHEAFREEIRGFLRAELCSRAHTIQGGTSNILRGIIAHRGLGLPAD